MMNCNKQYTIKVTEGNAFGLLLQLKSRTFQSSVPIDEDIDATHLEDIVIKVNNEAFTDFTVDESGVLMNIPADMAVGTYNVELTGSYYDVEIRAGYFQCFSIVPWSYQSDAVNYIQGSPIATEAAYVVVGIIDDQELEDLKAELRLKIAAAEAAKEAAEQAKEDFDEKAENLDNLDNVAQQGTNENATLTNTQAAAIAANQYGQTINNKIGEPQSGQPNTLFGAIANITIDTSTIAKQGTNASATLTTTQAAVVDGNDTAITAIKDVRSEVGTSSDTASETGTTLFSVLKWVKDKVKSIFNLIGSPASGQPSTLFAAIAAGGGGGGDAQESTSQAILAQVNAIVNSHVVTNIASDGYVFTDGTNVYGIGALLAYPSQLVSITDSNVTEITIPYFLSQRTSLQSISLPNLTYIGSTTNNVINYVFYRCYQLRHINFPRLTTALSTYMFQECTELEEIDFSSVTSGDLTRSFWGCTKLKKLNLLNWPKGLNGDTFYNAPKVIDLIIGRGFTTSVNISPWSPTEALLDNSQTLLTEEDIQAGFTSNREKLVYNIREHIAANLPDLTGQSALTITFHANVKAAVNADTATAQAFSNKNWTIS